MTATGQEQTGDDDTKRKFREALERKKAKSATSEPPTPTSQSTAASEGPSQADDVALRLRLS